MNKSINLVLLVSMLAVLVPAASADVGYCDGTGSLCGETFHYHSGNCNPYSVSSYNYNGGEVDTLAQVGTSQVANMHVYAYDYCYAYNFPGYSATGKSINLGVYGTTPAGFVSAGVSWYSYGGTYGSGCDEVAGLYTTQTGFVAQNVGSCPLGAPPTQPFTVLP